MSPRLLLLVPVIALGVWHGPARLVRWAISRPVETAPASPVVVQVSAPAGGAEDLILDRSQVLRPGAVCELANVSGDIVVRRVEGKEAHLHAVYHGRTRVEVRADEGGLRAKAVYPHGPLDEEGEVDYTLDLPAGVALQLRTVSGDVEVSDVAGAVNVRAVSGSVDLSRVRGDVSVEAVSSDVKLMEPTGRLQVRTVSGDVEAMLPRDTAGGDIATVSGEIETTAPRGAGLGVHASSHSGEVRSAFGADGAARLSLTSMSGDIEVRAR